MARSRKLTQRRRPKHNNRTPIRLRQDFWKLDHRDPRHPATHIHALKEAGIDDPWNLVWSHLSASSYFGKPSLGEVDVRLAQLHTRRDLGLVIYETCSVDELRQFASTRRIRLQPYMTKNDLIETLEFADEAATFEGFSELPPELRVQTYELYMEGLKGGLQKFGGVVPQPPITRVSRLLRKEAVPVWEGVRKAESLRIGL